MGTAEIENLGRQVVDLKRHIKRAVVFCDGVVRIRSGLANDKNRIDLIQRTVLPFTGECTECIIIKKAMYQHHWLPLL